MAQRILVLGGDGYLGLPTAMALSRAGHRVAAVDNFAKREWEAELGVRPLFPIGSLHERARAWREGCPTPWRRPSACLSIWSHKLLRWATPLLASVALVAAALLVVGGSAAYLVPIGVAIVVGVLGLAGLALRRRGRTPRWASLPLAVLVVNAAFLLGWANVIRGRSIGAWHRTEWTPIQPSADGSDRSA